MRRAARTDRNHEDVVRALRAIGCSVQSLAALGKGVPDLLCARRNRMWLLEVKDGKKPPSERKLTQDQLDWIASWRAVVHVVTSPQEAIDLVEASSALKTP